MTFSDHGDGHRYMRRSKPSLQLVDQPVEQ